jgi:hypothetical protein
MACSSDASALGFPARDANKHIRGESFIGLSVAAHRSAAWAACQEQCLELLARQGLAEQETKPRRRIVVRSQMVQWQLVRYVRP